MRQSLSYAAERLLDPRKMLLVAALIAAMGFVAGYVEVHEAADRELALRQGPPTKIALQSFSPVLHTGPADEVYVRAEADFTRATVLTLHGSDPARRALVVPLYSLSEIGGALIEADRNSGGTALTAQVARRAVDARTQRRALGILYHPLAENAAAPDDPTALATDVFGPGRNGTVVELNGESVDPGGFILMAAGAFSVMDIGLSQNYLAVRPYTEGRLAALTVAPPQTSHRGLFAAAILLGLLAVAISLHQSRRDDLDDPAHVGASEEDDLSSDANAAHPSFAPIPSQREIIEAASVREPEPPHWALTASQSGARWAWVALVFLGSAVMALVRWIRNRLSRREDGVL